MSVSNQNQKILGLDHVQLSLTDLLLYAKNKFKSKCAFSQYDDTAKQWKTLSFSELYERTERGVLAFSEAGLSPGDRVVVLGEPSFEWIESFYSIVRLGGVVIPLDVKLTDSELSDLIHFSEPSIILAAPRWLELARHCRLLKSGKIAKIRELTESALGASEWNDASEEIDTRQLESREEIAVISYTSGTQGRPKGVLLKRSGFLYQAAATFQCFGASVHSGSAYFSILPWNHAYGVTTTFFGGLSAGYETVIPHSITPEGIQKCLKDRRVTTMIVVPLYLRLVMNTILGAVKEKGKVAERVFDGLLKASALMPKAEMRKRLFAKVHERLGGSLEFFITGGAALPGSVNDFFEGIGLPVYDGYGLTETSPIISVNHPGYSKKGTVGRPMPGIQVRVSPEGELQTKGPHLMKGYFKNPEETEVVFTEDGWFRTGDIARLDPEGAVRLLGRQKALIVLSSGKKVHPEEIEALISLCPLVRFSGVVGVSDPSNGLEERVVAVIQPRDDLVKAYQGRFDVLDELIRKEVHNCLSKAASYKQPSEILIWESGLPLTSSMKVKRGELKIVLESRATSEVVGGLSGLSRVSHSAPKRQVSPSAS
jgi:long-chain acyl-CoA synthetase